MPQWPSPLSNTPDFRVLFESAPGNYLVVTPGFTIVAVSDGYLRATMTGRGAILGRGIFDVFPDNPDDPAASGVANLRASLERVRERGVPDAMAVQKYDIRRPESEGGGFEERYWSPVNSPAFGADGRLAYIIHRVEDVTEFVRLRLRGQEADERVEQLRTRAGTMEAEIYRRAQELQEANRQLRELQSQLEARVRERTADLEREMAERQRTEEALRHSESQLRQSQKLEAIGRLAGGVSHDFNNLLTAIMGYAQLGASGSPAEAGPYFAEIQGAAERAAVLTAQLLAFSRQQVLAPRVVDLHATLAGTDRLLRRLIGEDIDFVTASGGGPARVRVDPGQIEQVLMNLVVNARDAMPHGGKLTIETARVELDEDYAREHPDVGPGPYVMVAVSDTGVGMDAETRARLFEPFFTTKELGKGTGLGLSTVHGIVKQSGGHIEVYSEPGRGTTMKIYLPAVDGEGAPEAVAPVEVSRLEGNEAILLVEDEPAIRNVVRETLQRHGYSVIEAADGSEALGLCERPGARIDLIVSDVIMPLMNGPEFVSRVTRTRPDLKVLFVSGYTDRALVHQGLRQAGTAFLQKPFTPTTLLRHIREVLDGPPGAVS